jgi:hypothetical protein
VYVAKVTYSKFEMAAIISKQRKAKDQSIFIGDLKLTYLTRNIVGLIVLFIM